jgi:hypothetical protein
MNPLRNTIAEIAALPSAVLSTKKIYEIGRSNGMKFKDINAYFMREEFKVGRGQFDLTNTFNGCEVSKAAVLPVVRPDAGTESSLQSVERTPSQAVHMKQKVLADTGGVYVPEKDATYVAWGDFNSVKKIVASRQFFPLYICGESGNGKSMLVEQVCAQLKREYVRIQFTPETDSSELIGSFRLVEGETVFHKGPVVRAMEQGAICLLDELDRAGNKAAMALQGILEGKPILIKQIGEVVYPAPGFNVIATANTKGHGSDDGKYSAATIIDEAFLERFVGTIEQPFPTEVTEKKILINHCDKFGVKDFPFVEKLVAWSNVIRKTYKDGGVDQVISTRRLCHIIKTHSIFNNRKHAIAMCIARFDEDVRSAFTDLYDKIDCDPGTIENEVPEINQ